jgi:hypothetical protein
LKEAAAEVAEENGAVSKKALYNAVLTARRS